MKDEEQVNIDDRELFYTRSKANRGVRLELYTPDGNSTDHWIEIYGVHSDSFKRAEMEAQRHYIEARRLADSDELNEAEKEEAKLELFENVRLQTAAALVKSWSFSADVSKSNVIEFLREAPQILELINKKAADYKLFT